MNFNITTKRFTMINEGFTCQKCAIEVSLHPTGSARNHCNYCLYSLHLDKDFPWDRLSECRSLMKPVAKDYHKNKWWLVLHECVTCGKKITNKLAEDDNMDVYNTIS